MHIHHFSALRLITHNNFGRLRNGNARMCVRVRGAASSTFRAHSARRGTYTIEDSLTHFHAALWERLGALWELCTLCVASIMTSQATGSNTTCCTISQRRVGASLTGRPSYWWHRSC